MTVKAIDSSFAKPTPALVALFKAQGIEQWNGYLATKPGVGIAAPWTKADFDLARQLGVRPIAYCSGADDPAACKALAAEWDVTLGLDVESGIRADGPWVQPWLNPSGAGLYGNESVHPGRFAPFHILAAYPGGGDPGVTWAPQYPRPAGPCGWQWRGTHIQNGISIDAANLDDAFRGTAGDEEMNAGMAEGLAVILDMAGLAGRTREGDGAPPHNTTADVANKILATNGAALIDLAHDVAMSPENKNYRLAAKLVANHLDEFAKLLGVENELIAMRAELTAAEVKLGTLDKEINPPTHQGGPQ